MKLQINHFSQYDPKILPSQQNKSCGICSVKIVLDFLFPAETHQIDNLIHEAVIIKAFDQNLKGGMWTHEGLVRVLRNHGTLAYPQEFKSVTVNLDDKTFSENSNKDIFIKSGIEKIKSKLEEGKPVIASVTSGFNKNRDDHMVVISGYENSREPLFYITDPQDENLEKVTLETFLKHWKKLAIFID